MSQLISDVSTALGQLLSSKANEISAGPRVFSREKVDANKVYCVILVNSIELEPHTRGGFATSSDISVYVFVKSPEDDYDTLADLVTVVATGLYSTLASGGYRPSGLRIDFDSEVADWGDFGAFISLTAESAA